MEILSRIIQVSLASEVELHETDSVTDTLSPNAVMGSDVASPVYQDNVKNRPNFESTYKKI